MITFGAPKWPFEQETSDLSLPPREVTPLILERLICGHQIITGATCVPGAALTAALSHCAHYASPRGR